MKGLRCVGFATLLLSLFVSSGGAQSYTVTPYAGYFLPRNGIQATTHAVGNPTSVIRDAAGGFYAASIVDSRIYRVTADGSLTVIAGNGTAGFSGDGGRAVSGRAELSASSDGRYRG
jgi:hypothetical protein